MFNQFGNLERCSLRSGNLHSADGWRDVLEPVVARYRGGAIKRRFFGGDAAFALPELYDFLEPRATSMPSASKPTRRSSAILPLYSSDRWVGRPAMSGGSVPTSTIRRDRGAGNDGWSPRSSGIRVMLYPRVGFIVTKLARGADRIVEFYNQRVTAEQYIKEGKNAVKWTRLLCRTMRGNGSAAPALCACLQPRQFSAHSRASARGAALVADQYPLQTREDRREARRPCKLRHLSDGRVSSAPRPVPPCPRQHSGSAVSTPTPCRPQALSPASPPTGKLRPIPVKITLFAQSEQTYCKIGASRSG